MRSRFPPSVSINLFIKGEVYFTIPDVSDVPDGQFIILLSGEQLVYVRTCLFKAKFSCLPIKLLIFIPPPRFQWGFLFGVMG